MPGTPPDTIFLYRIVHISNVPYLLSNGMFTRSHPKADPDYINIGDSNLIQKRTAYPIQIIPPGGMVGDCVPFYFGPLSPMLLNIKTGYRGIVQRPQEEIVYILCKLTDVVDACKNWCFTDGHAKDAFSRYYNQLNDLHHVDWSIVGSAYGITQKKISAECIASRPSFW